MSSGWLLLLLALEITSAGRSTADRNGTACADPANEHRELALGSAAHSRRVLKLGIEVAQSSVAKDWSSGVVRPVRYGERSCGTTHRTLLPWICSWFLHLWHGCHTPTSRHGHPGQAYGPGLALAEWLCRTADRIDPARVCRSFDRLEP